MFFLKKKKQKRILGGGSIHHVKHLTFHGQRIKDMNGQLLEIKTQECYKDIKMCSFLSIIKFKWKKLQ